MDNVTFGDLAPGDRFKAHGTLWTKLSHETARRHTPDSRELEECGWGYHGDPVCSFRLGEQIAFIPPDEPYF